MGVPEIMHTNLLYTGFFTSSEHFMVQEIKGKVRRAKLNYLRDRVGKAAKVKELVK